MAMNLGSANLRYVNTSRPQLLHSHSQQSIAASDDYYSLSENSGNHSSDEKNTLTRYETPPSRRGSASALNNSGNQASRSQRDARLETHREVSGNSTSALESTPSRLQYDRPAVEDEVVELPSVGPPSTVRFVKNTVGTKGQPTKDMSSWQPSRSGVRPTTPGVDDTPYIQFAIDQLTRDEEALGHSRDATGSPDIEPVSPLNSSENLSREQGPPAYRVRDHTSPEPVVLPQRRDSVSPLGEGQRESEHMLLPARPPPDQFRYPALNFIPASINLLGVGAFCLACLVLIALLIASMVYSGTNDGLWTYDGVGTARYFVAEYLPQLLAVVIMIWLQVVLAAVQRILPFVLLTKQSQDPRSHILGRVPLYVTNHLIPNRSMLRKGEPILGYAAISFWLMLFTVPLASGLYQTRLFTAWCWATVQPVAVILIVLYINLMLALILLHIRLRTSPTGLKWDPVSLADILVLMRRSSTLSSPRNSHLPEYLATRPVSLGYWESTSRPGDFFHGIGASQSPTRLQLSNGKAVARAVSTPPPHPPQTSTFESWASATPQNSQPRFLRTTYLVLYAVIAIVLLLAFLIASYLHSPLLEGFPPRLPTATTATSTFPTFSPSNFLYSFLPALLGLALPLLWAPLDAAARYLAPYVTLARGGSRGIPAEKSLLLSYPADAPGLVVLRAAANGHLAVAASSALGLIAWAVPVLAGGIFTAQFVDGVILVRAEVKGLGALSAFLVVCALGWVAVWPVTRLAMRTKGARSGAQGGGRDVEKAAGEEATSPEGWLGEADVRVLEGVRHVVGDEVLGLRLWREPRSREDLVGRLVGRGRGRWSWNGEGKGVERISV